MPPLLTGRRAAAIVLSAALLAAVLVTAVGASTGRTHAKRHACTRYASLAGDDSNAGSSDAPFRSIEKLFSTLAPGNTGCLLGGTFGERLAITHGGTPVAPITIESAPGARATIVGGITVEPGATDVRVYNVAVRGVPNDPKPTISITADRFQLLGGDVTGSPAAEGRGCIVIDHAAQAVVDSLTIHDCGARGSSSAAGVMVVSSQSATISNNFISNTMGDAISLAPGAKRNVVSHNLIDGNQSGVHLAGTPQQPNGSNRISTNIISNSQQYDVHADYAGQTKVRTGNVVSNNCLWHGGIANVATSVRGAFVLKKNVTADPRFVDRAHGFGLRAGPCLARRPVHRTDDVFLVGGPSPLIALQPLSPFSIDFDGKSYTVYPIHPGSSIKIFCVSGCRGSYQHTVGSASSLRTTALVGSFGTIRFEERLSGWVGRYKLLVVKRGGTPHSKPGPFSAFCLPPRSPTC